MQVTAADFQSARLTYDLSVTGVLLVGKESGSLRCMELLRRIHLTLAAGSGASARTMANPIRRERVHPSEGRGNQPLVLVELSRILGLGRRWGRGRWRGKGKAGNLYCNQGTRLGGNLVVG